MTHICVSKITLIASDNGLSPGRHQAIIWNNDGILLIWPLETSFSEILIEIHSFSFKKMHLKMSSGKWRPFCLGLNVLKGFPNEKAHTQINADTTANGWISKRKYVAWWSCLNINIILDLKITIGFMLDANCTHYFFQYIWVINQLCVSIEMRKSHMYGHRSW